MNIGHRPLYGFAAVSLAYKRGRTLRLFCLSHALLYHRERRVPYSLRYLPKNTESTFTDGTGACSQVIQGPGMWGFPSPLTWLGRKGGAGKPLSRPHSPLYTRSNLKGVREKGRLNGEEQDAVSY